MIEPRPTTDLLDEHEERAQFCSIDFVQYGSVERFAGEIVTVRCFEDNSLLVAELAKPANGAVLVVDGAGSRRRALAGDNVAGIAVRNGWAGLVVFGSVRDVDALRSLPLGIKALGPCPRRPRKEGGGEAGAAVSFGGVAFRPGAELHSDADGIVVLG